MPVEPWIFISYGRPENKLALAISSHLWADQIETYNYIHKSVVEREFELSGITYTTMQEIAKLWILILTPRSVGGDVMWFREGVLNEIRRMQDDNGTPLVCLSTDKIVEQSAFHLMPDYSIDLSACDSPASLSLRLVALLPAELVDRCRSSWRINHELSHAAWSLLDADMQTTNDTSALPSAGELLKASTGGISVEDFISEELSSIQTEGFRWLLLIKLAQCLETVDPFQSRSLMSAAHSLQQKEPELLAEAVAEKDYGPSETISSVSELIRGVVRFGDKLGMLDAHRSYDIACRVTWIRIRQVLLCAVYRVARTMAENELCEAIRRQLAGRPPGI